MTKTQAALSVPNITTIVNNTGARHSNTDAKMTYTEKKNIDKAICQKSRKRDE